MGADNEKLLRFGNAEFRQLRGKNRLERSKLVKAEAELREALERVQSLTDKRDKILEPYEERERGLRILEKYMEVLESSEDEETKQIARIAVAGVLHRSTTGNRVSPDNVLN